ncbi:MAG: alpha/beta hydrolase fold domain-containing protein [Microcystaceae cyanobacterium]
MAQLSETARWATAVSHDYRTRANITYLRASNVALKLDLYVPKDPEKPVPTLIYFHGGGWVTGKKEDAILGLLPYIEKGWGVVVVQYRLASVSHAPAAVEDCLCSLRWVIRNADKYNFDVNKIVVSGHSAGGHLALTTGMIPESEGLANQCSGEEELKVAAIINWFGVTNVEDLLSGENQLSVAVQWIGSRTNSLEVAQRVSPIHYVRKDLPPILTIHGDADDIVPYSQATELHQALEKMDVPNELITISDGGHGRFSKNELLEIYETIHDFLNTHLEE